MHKKCMYSALFTSFGLSDYIAKCSMFKKLDTNHSQLGDAAQRSTALP